MKDEKTDGLTVWSLDKARELFKGGTPNDLPGEPVEVIWKTVEKNKDEMRFSAQDMNTMGAMVGDLVYLCDKRKWLGGLKSVHSIYGKPHDVNGVVYITNIHKESGRFDKNLKLVAEKEL